MTFINLIARYLFWHYGTGVALFFRLWGTSFWFMNRLFSVPLLLSTLFSPWRRMSEDRKGRGLEGFFSALIINTIMRLVGLVFRLCLLLAFVVSICVVLVLGAAAFVLWLLFPFAIVIAFISGIILIFL